MSINDEEVEDFLEHFGIKGMRWGIRKRPESLTPSKTDTEITKIVKNDYNKLNSKDFFMKYATTKSRYAKRVEKVGDPYLYRVNQQNKDKAGGFTLTPQQAPFAIYGGIVAISILAAIGRKRADSGIKEARKTGDKPFKENPKLKSKMSVIALQKNVVKQINPNYGDVGTKMNCRRATMAYEMRRRGFDVKATPSKYATGQTIKNLKRMNTINKREKFESVWGQKQVSKPKEFARMSSQQKAEAVFDSLSKSYPNGARGEIGSGWIMGGGHSQAFEIINKKPVIFDTQNGKVYNSPTSYSVFAATTATIAHTRLDDKVIDRELIKRWVTDV